LLAAVGLGCGGYFAGRAGAEEQTTKAPETAPERLVVMRVDYQKSTASLHEIQRASGQERWKETKIPVSPSLSISISDPLSLSLQSIPLPLSCWEKAVVAGEDLFIYIPGKEDQRSLSTLVTMDFPTRLKWGL
jgi:hypothetical protein